jgi:hypothetical protein
MIVAILLGQHYGIYLNRWVPRRRNRDGVSPAAGDNSDRQVPEAMSGPADMGAGVERGSPLRQDQ